MQLHQLLSGIRLYVHPIAHLPVLAVSVVLSRILGQRQAQVNNSGAAVVGQFEILEECSQGKYRVWCGLYERRSQDWQDCDNSHDSRIRIPTSGCILVSSSTPTELVCESLKLLKNSN